MSATDRLNEIEARANAADKAGVFESDAEPRREGDAYVIDVTDDEAVTHYARTHLAPLIS